MAIMFFVLGGMFILLAILLVAENIDSINFKAFTSVACWLVFLGIFSFYMGYLMR